MDKVTYTVSWGLHMDVATHSVSWGPHSVTSVYCQISLLLLWKLQNYLIQKLHGVVTHTVSWGLHMDVGVVTCTVSWVLSDVSLSRLMSDWLSLQLYPRNQIQKLSLCMGVTVRPTVPIYLDIIRHHSHSVMGPIYSYVNVRTVSWGLLHKLRQSTHWFEIQSKLQNKIGLQKHSLQSKSRQASTTAQNSSLSCRIAIFKWHLLKMLLKRPKFGTFSPWCTQNERQTEVGNPPDGKSHLASHCAAS